MATLGKAKEVSTGLWAKTKTEFFRTTQKAMVKIGKADETVDINFNQEKEKFKQQYKAVKKLKADAHRVVELMKELSVAQATLAEDFFVMFDPSSSMYDTAHRCQEIAKALDGERVTFDEEMRKDVLDPLAKYIGQFKEIKGRIAERETRLVDMDRYQRDLQIHREKAHTSKTPVAEQKYNASKENYLALNDELVKDIPLLIEDRIPFFEPCMASFATHIAHYYENSEKIVGDLAKSVAHINRSTVIDHPRVTTPQETSAATNKITVAKAAENLSSRRNTTALTPEAVNNAFEEQHQQQPSSRPTSQTVSNPNANRKQPIPPPVKSGPKARALYDFAAQEANELAFRTGDVITILSKNGDWWEGELNGRRGLIPANYLQLL